MRGNFFAVATKELNRFLKTVLCMHSMAPSRVDMKLVLRLLAGRPAIYGAECRVSGLDRTDVVRSNVVVGGDGGGGGLGVGL